MRQKIKMLSAWRGGANDQDCSFLCASFAAFGSASSGTAQATSSVMAGVQTVRLDPAFMGEQATYGPSYQGGLAPPPEWWLQFVHLFAPCQLAQLQQNYNNTWAQPCRWPTHPSTYPVKPTRVFLCPQHSQINHLSAQLLLHSHCYFAPTSLSPSPWLHMHSHPQFRSLSPLLHGHAHQIQPHYPH